MPASVKADGGRAGAAGWDPFRGRGFAIAVGVLTLAGLALRLWFLDKNPLWYDEAYTFHLAHQPTLAAFFRRLLTTDSHPPLFYLLARGMLATLGRHATALRLPSLVAGTAAIPLSATLGRGAAPRRARIFVAASVAFLPALVHFSVEARSYALLLALALGLAATYRAWLARPHPGLLAGLAVLSVAALYVHVFAGFVVAGLVLDGLVLRRRPDRTGVFIAATLGVALAGAPWLVAVFNQMARWHYIAGLARYLQPDVVLGRYGPLRAIPGRPIHRVGMGLFAALVAGAGVAALRAGPRKAPVLAGDPGAPAPRPRRLLAAASLLGAGLLLAGGVSVIRDGAFHRSLPLLAPFFLGRAAVVAGAALLGIALLPAGVELAWRHLGDRGRARWRRLARIDPDLSVPLLVVLAASAVAAWRPALGYKPLIVVIPGLLLFCAWALLRAWPRAGTVALSGFVALALVAAPFQGDYHHRADYRAAVPVLEVRRRPGQPVLLYPGHHVRQLEFYGPVPGVVPLWSSTPVRDARAVRLRPGEVFWLLAATDDGGYPEGARRVLRVLRRRARVTFHQAFFQVTLYRLVAR